MKKQTTRSFGNTSSATRRVVRKLLGLGKQHPTEFQHLNIFNVPCF